jgi:FRG domain
MKTLNDFFERVKNHRKRLGIARSPVWYRGHSCESYRLEPTILRRKNGIKHERNLFANFQTQGKALLPPTQTSWELLSVMQHHGVPTRLLDWTESLHTALFFAIHGTIESSCIWVLNPFKLNQKSTGKNVIYDDADRIELDYYSSICPPKAWPYDLPVAMALPWMHSRIDGQRGSFTFHGNNPEPLEVTCPDCVKRIPIPPQLVKEVREHLEHSGIDYFRLFPDLDGLAKSLKEQFRF